MFTRTLLVGTLALGLAACASETDATADVAADSDVSVAGSFEDAPAIPAGTYSIDPSHSRAEFRVRHLGISTVTGRFDGVDGTVTVGDGLGSLQTTATIDASTISTGNADRDGHLRSADFFDVEQYPEITFTSTELRPTAGGGFTLVGDLTMHGVTRPVELEAEYVGTANMMGTDKVGFTASGEINRQEWGLTWSQTNEAGEIIVSDEVELTIEVEADRQADAAAADAPAETEADA